MKTSDIDLAAHYSPDVQQLLLEALLSDVDAFCMCRSIIDPRHFDDSLQKMVGFVTEYSDQHRALPAIEQIRAYTGRTVEKLSEPVSRNWLLGEYQDFARYKAHELAVLDSMELLRTGRSGEIMPLFRAAMTISIVGDLGTDYFSDPRSRLERLRDNTSLISTGWETLDSKLFGGFANGSLNIFAAGSGAGKSLTLQNYALNMAFAGRNVVYITLELGEDLCSLRVDAMVTGFGTKEIMQSIDSAISQIERRQAEQKPGTLTIKKMPQGGTTVNHLRAYLTEYQIKTGVKPDILVVDYLDLLYPCNGKVDVSNLFIKDKFVSEELRELATEFGVPCATASQFNRAGSEATDYQHSHIAGGISKINSADTVIAVAAPPEMKERGRMKFSLMKTRSSSGIGQTIDMAYNPMSMRITDMALIGDVDRQKSIHDLKAELTTRTQSQSLPAADDRTSSMAEFDALFVNQPTAPSPGG